MLGGFLLYLTGVRLSLQGSAGPAVMVEVWVEGTLGDEVCARGYDGMFLQLYTWTRKALPSGH